MPLGLDSAPKTEPDKLADLLKWVGGGFALITGVAAFFGIKDGVLARVVRTQPVPTLWIFLLVGVGVVLALVIPAIKGDGDHVKPAPWWLIVLIGGGVAVATIVVAPDLPGPQDEVGKAPLAVVVAIACVLLALILMPSPTRLTVSWPVALLVLAITSLGCGLYMATKLSVMEKMRLESAAVVSSISTSDGQSSVEIAAAGTELAGPVRVRVLGTPAGQSDETVFGEQVLMPSRAGVLEAKATIPVPGRSWTAIRVMTCQEWNTAQREACEPNVQQASFEFEQQQSGLTATLTTTEDGKRIVYELGGSGYPAGSYVRVDLGPRGQTPQATARLRAGSDGAITWKGEIPLADTAVWSLGAEECQPQPPSEDRCAAKQELASLSVSP